ncbi:MAG TPA: adenylate/guanylate cyclase domain-containing protein [Gemmatimonadota bacterium]|nr:adenylate/guanylate cyclase domain-containing protein [Gemmatimonadota bacterium]
MSLPEIHPLTLRFDSDAHETAFLADYRASIRRQTRAVLGLVIVLYLGYGLLDRWLAPEAAVTIAWVRVLVCAVAGAVLVLTHHPAFDRWRDWLLGFLLIVAGAGILVMLAVDEHGQARNLYYAGLILVVLGGHALFRLRFPVAVALTFAIIVAYNVEVFLIGGFPWEVLLNNNFALVSANILGMFASYNVERYARRSFLDRLVIEAERRRSESLLLNVLPAAIAERLKSSSGAIADQHPAASVLFADIGDFTVLSSRLSPAELVELLNEVFTEFDHVARDMGVEKIKTVGDAYMVVAGLPLEQPDHLERIADTALAMRARIPEVRARRAEPLGIRIGVATGPVVAGVIGESKFSYDLWGDTVNTASRMERHGLVGRIQVTEPVFERLRDRYVFEPRGEVDVKGKGLMRTYWLEGKT